MHIPEMLLQRGWNYIMHNTESVLLRLKVQRSPSVSAFQFSSFTVPGLLQSRSYTHQGIPTVWFCTGWIYRLLQLFLVYSPICDFQKCILYPSGLFPPDQLLQELNQPTCILPFPGNIFCFPKHWCLGISYPSVNFSVFVKHYIKEDTACRHL